MFYLDVVCTVVFNHQCGEKVSHELTKYKARQHIACLKGHGVVEL